MRAPLRGAFAGLVAAATLASSSGATAAGVITFVNVVPGDAAGTTCPGDASGCFNFAGEPQIRADGDGGFFASSENGVGAGTDAWRSTDGGLHYTSLPSPNQLPLPSGVTVGAGGGDTDLAIAPVPGAGGRRNVYVASLSLANVTVSTSQDGGATWRLDPVAATIAGDDREWIAADGSSNVCISYHDVATFNIDVSCSADAGATFTQLGEAFDAGHLFLAQDNETGNLAIDASSHVIYQTFSGIANAGEVQCSQAGTCGNHVVYVATSTDGGRTFTDHVVLANPDATVSYGHQFANVSVDRAGNVYSVFSDDRHVFYSFSTDRGATWSPAVQVSQAPSDTAIFPWSVAGDAGKLDIVWYGTSFFDGVTRPDGYPGSANWFVFMAQSLDALGARSFTQVQASPAVHQGGVCESGVSCTGNRDLLDDFGVAASPTTGLASIAYTSDQFNSAEPNCTPAANDTSSCEHTAIATQTAGPGIFGAS